MIAVVTGLANSASDTDLDQICVEIRRLLDCLLPLSSSSLQKGDSKYSQFQVIFGSLMGVVRNCRNGLLVIRIVREHLFVDRDHIFMEDIMQTLNDFVGSLDLAQAKKIAEEVIQSVQHRKHGIDPASLNIQRSIVKKIGVSLIARLADLDRGNARDIFAKYCHFFLASIQHCSTESLDEMSKSICAIYTLMTFYRALDYNEIKDYVHPSYKPSDPDADKGMHYTQLVMKTLMRIRKEPKYIDPPILSICNADIKEDVVMTLRELHQTVQSAFITVVRRTQEKSSFVDLIFKDCAWEQIVDTKTTIKMEVQPNFKRNFDSLTDFRSRRGLRTQGRGMRSLSSGFAESYATLGNLTLEVGELSALFGVVSGDGSLVSHNSPNNTIENVVLESDEVNDNPVMIHFILLFDRIHEKSFHKNDHGTVPLWVREIRSIIEDTNPDSKRKNSLNVRLFAAKLLFNGTNRHPELFRSYAREFFVPFFDKDSGLATWLSKQGTTIGKIPGSFNSYLREICILWSSWIFPQNPDETCFDLGSSAEIEMGWNFLHNLIKVVPHDETAVAKSNVEYLSIFVQKWRKAARPEDLKVVIDYIKGFLTLSVSQQDEQNIDSCKRVEVCNFTGIQLLNLFLLQEVNEIESTSQPFVRFEIADLSSLFDFVLKKYVVPSSSSNKENRKYRAKRLLKPASQVCGLALACMEASSPEQGDKCTEKKESLREKVRALKLANQPDQALYAASSAVISNPALASLFDQLALENLIKLHGDFQCMALGILVEQIFWLCKQSQLQGARGKMSMTLDQDEAPDELKKMAVRLWADVSRNFIRLVEKQDEKLQLLALRLVTGRDEEGRRRCSNEPGRQEGLLAFLTLQDINAGTTNVLQSICSVFPAHRSEACRFHFYLLLMDLHEVWPQDERSQLIPSIDYLRHTLVTGVTDSSERVQYCILGWWNSTGVSKNPCSRLLELFERTRSADGLNFHWASTSAWLLLGACRQMSGEPLFDHPLENVKFKDMRISTHFSMGQSSMAPMFASSLQSTQQSSQMFQFSQTSSSSMQAVVMSTQAVEQHSQGEAVDASMYLDNQTLQSNDLFIARLPGGIISGRKLDMLQRTQRRRVTAVESADVQKVQFARRHEEVKAYQQKVKSERSNRVELLRKYRAGVDMIVDCDHR